MSITYMGNMDYSLYRLVGCGLVDVGKHLHMTVSQMIVSVTHATNSL